MVNLTWSSLLEKLILSIFPTLLGAGAHEKAAYESTDARRRQHKHINLIKRIGVHLINRELHRLWQGRDGARTNLIKSVVVMPLLSRTRCFMLVYYLAWK